MRTENAGNPRPRRGSTGTNGGSDRYVTHPLETRTAEDTAATASAGPPYASADQTVRLSSRAQNVLKELATELTGEIPPRGRWILRSAAAAAKLPASSHRAELRPPDHDRNCAMGEIKRQDHRAAVPYRKIAVRHVARCHEKVFVGQPLERRGSRGAGKFDAPSQYAHSHRVSENACATCQSFKQLIFTTRAFDGYLFIRNRRVSLSEPRNDQQLPNHRLTEDTALELNRGDD